MNVFWTIVAGAGTFVLGQIFLKLIIDPVQAFKEVIAEIAHKLILYANIYANPKPFGDKAQAEMSDDFRRLSSTLQANMHLIPFYRATKFLFGLPSQEKVIVASQNLIGLHNGYDGALANQGILNCYSAQKIRLALGIFIPEGERLDPELEKGFVKAKSN